MKSELIFLIGLVIWIVFLLCVGITGAAFIYNLAIYIIIGGILQYMNDHRGGKYYIVIILK